MLNNIEGPRFIGFVNCKLNEFKFVNVTHKHRELTANRYEWFYIQLSVMSKSSNYKSVRKSLELFITLLTKQCVLQYVKQGILQTMQFYENTETRRYTDFCSLIDTINLSVNDNETKMQFDKIRTDYKDFFIDMCHAETSGNDVDNEGGKRRIARQIFLMQSRLIPAIQHQYNQILLKIQKVYQNDIMPFMRSTTDGLDYSNIIGYCNICYIVDKCYTYSCSPDINHILCCSCAVSYYNTNEQENCYICNKDNPEFLVNMLYTKPKLVAPEELIEEYSNDATTANNDEPNNDEPNNDESNNEEPNNEEPNNEEPNNEEPNNEEPNNEEPNNEEPNNEEPTNEEPEPNNEEPEPNNEEPNAVTAKKSTTRKNKSSGRKKSSKQHTDYNDSSEHESNQKTNSEEPSTTLKIRRKRVLVDSEDDANESAKRDDQVKKKRVVVPETSDEEENEEKEKQQRKQQRKQLKQQRKLQKELIKELQKEKQKRQKRHVSPSLFEDEEVNNLSTNQPMAPAGNANVLTVDEPPVAADSTATDTLTVPVVTDTVPVVSAVETAVDSTDTLPAVSTDTDTLPVLMDTEPTAVSTALTTVADTLAVTNTLSTVSTHAVVVDGPNLPKPIKLKEDGTDVLPQPIPIKEEDIAATQILSTYLQCQEIDKISLFREKLINMCNRYVKKKSGLAAAAAAAAGPAVVPVVPEQQQPAVSNPTVQDDDDDDDIIFVRCDSIPLPKKR
ncbi:HOAR [Chrysodeixis includens nucleopolyhedrovirus]|uniref:HOAR n=1 Tax=Chrysodeixis includens nucleopolyhedrovirus TaxID=1207438 RepID=A0A5B8YSU6_9ABAC|nr:HOAR [Chrysodeixis includens nucleopolyhedrovirus]QED40532.1 HOAR [Chrysodeixis includens nucleopolyhedrovirus]